MANSVYNNNYTPYNEQEANLNKNQAAEAADPDTVAAKAARLACKEACYPYPNYPEDVAGESENVKKQKSAAWSAASKKFSDCLDECDTKHPLTFLEKRLSGLPRGGRRRKTARRNKKNRSTRRNRNSSLRKLIRIALKKYS
jgi:hypothetical protein